MESTKQTVYTLTLARARVDMLANVLMLVRRALVQVQVLGRALAWKRAEELAGDLAQKRAAAEWWALGRAGAEWRPPVWVKVEGWVSVLSREKGDEWALAQGKAQWWEGADEQALVQAKARWQEGARKRTRVREQEWAARARADVRTRARPKARPREGPEEWWTRAQMHVAKPGEVSADSELMDIIYSIDHGHGIARELWFSPETPEHLWLIEVIAPITRLPQELLHEILLIIIDNDSDSPFALMRVSKLWYSIVTGIWGSLKLGTSTPRDAVTRILERNQWLLDVIVDTEFDRGDFTPSEGVYQAIFAAIQVASRWRSLVVETVPAQSDLPEHLVISGLQQCTDAVMSRLRTVKVNCPCETSSFLQHLLRILGTTAGEELETVEINSASVILFLAPTYPSIFRSVKVLCLDIPRLPNPVDLLPHLHQLEELTVSHLSLPIYHDDVNIPFVHTLRHLTLRAVSFQWMSGRTFHALESCTFLFPLHRHVLQSFSTTLPNCNRLTFQGYPLDILNGVSAQNLTYLSVSCPCFEKPRGSRQLVWFYNHALRDNQLAPRVLHISIEATGQTWMKAFSFMSNLEELVIENAQPSSIGRNVLKILVVPTSYANGLGTTATHGGRYTPLCPSLKRFGLRYRRWLRSTEHFDLIPELVSIILSRQQSKFPLQSFHLWKKSGQQNPLELIEGSWISFKAFESLTNTGDLLRLVASRLADGVSKS